MTFLRVSVPCSSLTALEIPVGCPSRGGFHHFIRHFGLNYAIGEGVLCSFSGAVGRANQELFGPCGCLSGRIALMCSRVGGSIPQDYSFHMPALCLVRDAFLAQEDLCPRKPTSAKRCKTFGFLGASGRFMGHLDCADSEGETFHSETCCLFSFVCCILLKDCRTSPVLSSNPSA